MTIWPTSTLEQPRFRQRLGVRLATLLGVGAVLSATLATAAMLAMAWYFADRDRRDEAHQVAVGLAFALQAPVSFEDAQGIVDAVAVLRARPQIQGAWVHDAKGRLLYSTVDASRQAGAAGSGGLAQGWLRVDVPIVAGSAGDTVGRVSLHLNLEDARRQLRVQALAAAAAGLLAATLALLLSQRLARRISVPMVQLAATAARITRDQNYELRLPAGGTDELGVAVNAFNHMLDEIDQRGTALLSMNQQLQQQADLAQAAQARAEAASQAKTRFLANMSHELRSPLNGVIGAAQLLQAQGADAARRAELVDIIRTSGSNLLGLIEHVLDLARIEAGALVLEPHDFNLMDCLEAAVQSSGPLASAKGLRLSCQVDPAMALWRHGDEVRLRQLLLNLLGNAVKFTAQGDVSVDVRPAGASADRLQIQIRDTGIGVAPQALATIFEPFQQADASTTRRFGGSGLGLAICRDLARLMGGDVVAQSIPGVGSCFTLDLPLPLARQAGDQARPMGLRVAWCEPHEPSALALAALLQRMGCEAQRCHDLAGLRAFMQVPDARGRPPWFIVATDAEPGRLLLAGALPWIDPGHVLPIDGAVDPAHAHTGDVPGLPRPMARPVLRSALVSRLGASVTGRPPQAPTTTPLPVAGQGAGRVLVAEDDAINQAVVRSMLEHAGFTCTVACNGERALQLLAQAPFDLVLMDWQMPDMDGLEATRRLRRGDAGERNRQVPVVALTANAFAEDREACLAAGMNDFVTKPVLATHLVAVVERWAVRDRWPGTTPSDGGPAATAAPAAATTPAYDPAVLRKLPMVADGSDPGYVDRLLDLFARTVDQTLATIAQAIADTDLLAVQHALHSLKSSAGQVGALALAAEAARGEAALRRGELEPAALPPLLQRLQLAHRRFADAVVAQQVC